MNVKVVISPDGWMVLYHWEGVEFMIFQSSHCLVYISHRIISEGMRPRDWVHFSSMKFFFFFFNSLGRLKEGSEKRDLEF